MITINFNSYLNITKALSACSSVETVNKWINDEEEYHYNTKRNAAMDNGISYIHCIVKYNSNNAYIINNHTAFALYMFSSSYT